MKKEIFKKTKSQEGWTFMETLIVIAVVMVLTASTGFMAAGSLEKARIAAARAQIDSFCTALEAYYIDCGTYPTTEQGLSALYKKPESGHIAIFWNGPYIYKNVPLDPWGTEYEYRSPGYDGSDFSIRSFGADRTEGGDDKNADITSWSQ